MGEPEEHYTKWNKSDANDNSTWYHLPEESKIVKVIEAESRMVVLGGRGVRNGGVLVDVYKVMVIQDD